MKEGTEKGTKFYSSDTAKMDAKVFFNSDMETNRDLSYTATKVFSNTIDEEIRIADALSASGIRGMRYTNIGEVWMNDANPSAVEAIQRGLEENNLNAHISEEDANVFLSQSKNFFHYIDIDPYGSFVDFLDSSARVTHHNGFAGFTATDNAAPAGSYPKVCKRRYGSKPLKNSFMHETGLRIYLKEVFENYARYDKCFDPKICWHEQHYTRIMGRVTESKKRTNRALDNIGCLSYCPECRWRKLERKTKCQNCGNKDLKIAGPLWTGKIADQRFTEKMLEETPVDWGNSRKILEKIHNESEIITPFYDLHKLCSHLNMSVPKLQKLIDKIREKGYPVSRTHFSPTGFRTDAPVDNILQEIKNLNVKQG